MVLILLTVENLEPRLDDCEDTYMWAPSCGAVQ